jgi:hypothetical protein
VYSQKSNDDLARQLLNNFDAFKDPKTPWFVTTQGLSDMANKPLTGNPAQDQNIRLARELLRRPEVVHALDRHSSTGALDGLIDRQKIQMTLSSQSPLKYQDDSRLAQEMLEHFEGLKDPANPGFISIDKLHGLASWPTSDPVHGRLAGIAQEVLKRAEVKENMDGGDYWGKDGWIHWDTLRDLAEGPRRRCLSTFTLRPAPTFSVLGKLFVGKQFARFVAARVECDTCAFLPITLGGDSVLDLGLGFGGRRIRGRMRHGFIEG